MLTDADAAPIATPILERLLTPFGFDRVEVASGFNHAEIPALFVTVHYKANAPKPNGRILLDAAVEVNAAIAKAGDERFVYVNHRYQDGESAGDDFGQPKRRSKSTL
jgi:hypothetical protein